MLANTQIQRLPEAPEDFTPLQKESWNQLIRALEAYNNEIALAKTVYLKNIQLEDSRDSLLNPPVPGTIETEGGHLYFTNAEEERKAVVLVSDVVTSSTTVSNTSTETAFLEKTFEANELKEHSVMKVTCMGTYSNASSSDDFEIKFNFGGSTFHTIQRIAGNVTNQGWKFDAYFTVRSVGVSGTMVDFCNFNDGGDSSAASDGTVHSIDTTVSLDLDVTITWDNAKVGNTFTCNQGFIEVLH